jgi:hypothetical protein
MKRIVTIEGDSRSTPSTRLLCLLSIMSIMHISVTYIVSSENPFLEKDKAFVSVLYVHILFPCSHLVFFNILFAVVYNLSLLSNCLVFVCVYIIRQSICHLSFISVFCHVVLTVFRSYHPPSSAPFPHLWLRIQFSSLIDQETSFLL